MHIKETKMVPNLTKDPTPCLQDENVVVYSILILAVNKKVFAPCNEPCTQCSTTYKKPVSGPEDLCNGSL
jgi:hypothetical protein